MAVNTADAFLLELMLMVKIFCDACGTDVHDGMNNEFAHFSANQGSWGYNSPWDMWKMDYQLCVTCVSKALDALDLNPDDEPVTPDVHSDHN